jgi:putative endopeptidase
MFVNDTGDCTVPALILFYSTGPKALIFKAMMKLSLLLILWPALVFSQQRQFIDSANLDLRVKPGDDFYTYANGGWLAKNGIPANEPGWGEARLLELRNLAKLRHILEKAALGAATNHRENLIGKLYGSGMDTLLLERLGLEPVRPDLNRIGSIQTKAGVLKEIAYEHTLGLAPIFDFYARQDQKNSSRMIACFDQGGLGLPDQSYYLTTDDAENKRFREVYLNYIQQLLKMTGVSDGAKAARGILQLETLLAKASKSPVELRDVEANYHKFAVKGLQKAGFNWPLVLKGMGCSTDSVIISQPVFFTAMATALRQVPVAVWKDYLRFHLMDSRAPFLDKQIQAAAFNFHGKLLQGLSAPQDRWQQVAGTVDDLLGDALGFCYVNSYFSPKAKGRMDSLVANVRLSFEEHIQKLDWMSAETKAKALTKLHAITNKVGYPDHWLLYAGLELSKGQYEQDAVACMQYRYREMIRELARRVDRTKWGMTPPTVNAYYDFSKNEIVFPAGILQYPYFDADADDAVNYGAIGVVIGHELSHAFDDQGSRYDAAGNLRPWWSKQDEEAFKQRTDAMVKLYNQATILDSLHINGELTLGENIADFGGIAIAFDAFRKTRQYQENKRINGFTPAQRFFLSFAQSRRRNARAAYLKEFIKNNAHAPSELRVNIPFSNFAPFYEAFDVQQGDKMWRQANQRLGIW